MNSKEDINRFGKGISTSLLAIVMVPAIVLLLSIVPVAAADHPWEGYLVPQNSTGSYGADTLVEVRVDITSTAVWGYQVDIHFDTSCVNITDVDWGPGNPFTNKLWSWQYNGGDEYVRIYGNQGMGGSPIPLGTYTLATYNSTVNLRLTA